MESEPEGDGRLVGAAGAAVEPWQVRAVAQVFVDYLSGATPIEIASDDAHHLRQVLRLNSGEPVVVSDGRGSWCEGAVVYSPSAVAIEPTGPVHVVPRPTPEITVGFVPVKGDRPEWVVQKLTELGTDRIVVLRSARSVVRWDGDRATKALERLQRVAVSAAAQSRRAWIPTLMGVLTLAELEKSLSDGLSSNALWVCHMDGETLGSALLDSSGGSAEGSVSERSGATEKAAVTEKSVEAERSAPDDSASVAAVAGSQGLPALAIGPEGGWDASERQTGERVVSLGGGVLRAETAAICAASLLGAWRNGTLRQKG